MKKLFLLYIFFVIASFFSACNDDPEFPDPKFGSSAIHHSIVRRDTADVYQLKCTMDVPNGIDYIEILDAVNNYETIDKIEQYAGKKHLDFSYSMDLTNIDSDTLLGYIVKIYDLKNRTYNKAFEIEVKKSSRPEIFLTNGDVMSVMLPFVSLQADLNTGMVPIKSIDIKLDGVSKKHIEPEQDTCTYSLHNVILQGLYEMKGYKVDIILEDVKGRIATKTQTIFRIDKIEKPIKVLLAGSIDAEMDLIYDSFERLSELDLVGQFKMKFFYENDRVTKIQEVEYGNYSDSINYLFNYDESGLLLSVKETATNSTVAQDIIYYNDRYTKRIKHFIAGAALIDNIAYTPDFVTDEFIFSEEWPVNINNIYPSIRLRMIDFDPILIPTYLESLPYPLIRIMRWPHLFHDLFLTKYVHSKTVSYLDDTQVKYNYNYSMDQKGRLSEWKRLYTDIERVDYYKFVYENDLND